jgi:predicted esterase
MGAWGAEQLHIQKHLPLYPLPDLWMSSLITTIPIRIFHGLLDDVVNVDYSIAIYKKLKACNADVELTILTRIMIAGRVYDNQEIYDGCLNK